METHWVERLRSDADHRPPLTRPLPPPRSGGEPRSPTRARRTGFPTCHDGPGLSDSLDAYPTDPIPSARPARATRPPFSFSPSPYRFRPPRTPASRPTPSRRCGPRSAAPPDSLADLADKDFAKVPLTKADAAAARELLWKAHAAIDPQGPGRRGRRTACSRTASWRCRSSTRRSARSRRPGGACGFRCTAAAAPRSGSTTSSGENQKKLYTLDEGIYLAPRAPTEHLEPLARGRTSTACSPG